MLFFSESFGDLGEHGQKNKNTNGKSEKGPEHVNNITKPCLKNAKQWAENDEEWLKNDKTWQNVEIKEKSKHIQKMTEERTKNDKETIKQ